MCFLSFDMIVSHETFLKNGLITTTKQTEKRQIKRDVSCETSLFCFTFF